MLKPLIEINYLQWVIESNKDTKKIKKRIKNDLYETI